METENKSFKLTSEDLHYLATNTDVPRAKLQEFYDQFVEEFSDGKITKEVYKNLMRVYFFQFYKKKSNYICTNQFFRNYWALLMMVS